MDGQTGEKLYFVYLKAILRGVLLSVLLLLISALVFYFTELGDRYLGSAVWVATVLGICYAGIYGANRIGSRGVIHGILLGVIYITILAGIGILAETGDINWISYAIMFAMGIVIGGMSGVIGINIGKTHRE